MRVDPKATDAYLRLARLHAAAGRDNHALTALAFVPGGGPTRTRRGSSRCGSSRDSDSAPKTPKQPAEDVAREQWSAGVAAIARGISDRDGPAAAVDVPAPRRARRLRRTRAHAEISEVWIESLAASGRAKEAVAKIEAALRGHADVAVLHALRGQALQTRRRRSRARARRLRQGAGARLRRAAGAARARGPRGRARGERRGARALRSGARRRSRFPHRRDRALRGEGAVRRRDGSGEAEERLAALLREHPYDAEAALVLAEQLRGARRQSRARRARWPGEPCCSGAARRRRRSFRSCAATEPPAPAADGSRRELAGRLAEPADERRGEVEWSTD